MDQSTLEETRAFWDQVSGDWDLQIGEGGDANRILNSDPVLWGFAGDVAGLNVLDAGCGTGYLARQLQAKGARVAAVDFSERMIAIAQAKAPEVDFRVDSCSELMTVNDASMDLLIANYVLMDTPDLDGTIQAFSRVLKAGGLAILIFSHPCFPQGRARSIAPGGGQQYQWDFSYFEQRKYIDPPWGHFSSEFLWFHRPLSDYWKAFTASGFEVVDFEEPRLTEDRYDLAENQEQLNKCKNRPYSVAFKLRKRGTS